VPPLPQYNVGDIVKWRAFVVDVDYYYGMVLACEEVKEIGHMDYPFHSYDEMGGIDYDRFFSRKITLFSFYEQRIVIVNQTDQDVPTFPELVFPA
jgi:hypothetical protein